MKHPFIVFLSICLCLLSVSRISCTGKEKYIGYYISYDIVDVREAPSEDAKVVLKLSCERKPSKFDKKAQEIPYAFLSDDKKAVSVGVRKIDESGKWGYIDESIPLIRNRKGWIPLDEMIYVGTGDASAKRPSYQVKGERWITMYRHPKEDDKDKAGGSLYTGEIVQQYATAKGGWVFVDGIVYSTVGNPSHHYGWINTKNLTKTEDSSEEDMTVTAYELLEERMGNQKDTIKMRNVLYHIFRVLSFLALIFTVIFLVPSFIHRRPTSVLFVFPIFALYMFIFTEVWAPISLFYGLLMPMAAYTILYPVLYLPSREGSRKDVFYPWAFNVLSIVPALYVMGVIEFAKSPKLLGHIVTVVFYAVLIIIFTYFLGKLVYEDICTHCGYYGGHRNEGTEDLGTSVSESSGVEDVYVGSSTRTVGNTEVTTDHYKRTPYTLVTSVHRYRIIRRCRKCDKIYYNYRSETNSSKR